MDRYKVLYQPRSLTDIRRIVGYIAEDSESVASSFGSALLDHIDLLEIYPRMGVATRRGQVRKLIHGPIVVYYRVIDRSRVVEILHVRHGSRKPLKD